MFHKSVATTSVATLFTCAPYSVPESYLGDALLRFQMELSSDFWRTPNLKIECRYEKQEKTVDVFIGCITTPHVQRQQSAADAIFDVFVAIYG